MCHRQSVWSLYFLLQLIGHLQGLVDARDPGRSNYRSEFLNLDTDEALTHIITGIGELIRGELAGDRMTVAYQECSQEDQHSCFSDNTTADIIGNAVGIQMVLTGNYGSVAGVEILDVAAAVIGMGLLEAIEEEDILSQTDPHDADGRPDFLAAGREWSTPPLWGIGLVERVNNHTRFLHDGRARDLSEAILWHGGEAENSRTIFRNMSKEERDALIAFLKSL